MAAFASVAIAAIQGASIAPPPLGDLVTEVAAGLLIGLAWAAVGAALAVALRSTAIPIGIGFAFLLVNQLIASLADRSGLLADIARALVGTDAGSLARAVLPAGTAVSTPGLNTLLDGAGAAVALGVYVIGAAMLSLAIVSRRDVH